MTYALIVVICYNKQISLKNVVDLSKDAMSGLVQKLEKITKCSYFSHDNAKTTEISKGCAFLVKVYGIAVTRIRLFKGSLWLARLTD